MTNSFYNPTGKPSTSAAALSVDMRTEFANIAAGFALLPTFTGKANKIVVVNAGETALTTPSDGSPLPGVTTNTTAATGNVGEYLSTVVTFGGRITLTTATAANLASRSLTAGDWDVWANVTFIPDGTTTVSQLEAGITTSTATMPTTATDGYMGLALPFTTGSGQIMPVGATRILLAATTTYYLVVRASFAVAAMKCYGAIMARRRT